MPPGRLTLAEAVLVDQHGQDFQGAVVLEISNLSKRYGEVVALDGASFTVPRGRIVGFLGPNGAGKTTAMRSVFGLVRPDGGSITWDGEPIGSEQRLRFGYMPEERGLYPRMRLAEQLAYFGRLSGMPRADAAQAASWWLARLGLSDRTDARLEQLSHGNQQRVQLAAALIHEPELAVLDEPFAGLDPLGVDSMGELMATIVETGMSILFSSHQLDLVEDICQDVVIINRGRVVLAGEVRELRSASPIRRLELWVDDHPWHGWGDGQAVTANGRPSPHMLVSSDTDVSEIVEKARAEGEITRLLFEPPRLSDLFREAVTS